MSIALQPSRREPALDCAAERFGGIFSAGTAQKLLHDSCDRLVTAARPTAAA